MDQVATNDTLEISEESTNPETDFTIILILD
jgi:hypothetical protein